jgi:hypothetical protein
MVALEDLKRTNEIITSSFKNDLEILQSKHMALATDHEQQKTQLIDALLSKDRLMKDLASFKERPGTSGDDAYQKAQSKAATEEENTRKALQEVSEGFSLAECSGPPQTRGEFCKRVWRVSFLPYSAQAQATEPEPASEPAPESSLGTNQAATSSPHTLEREYCDAIITRPNSRPQFSFHRYNSSAKAIRPGRTPEPDQVSLENLEPIFSEFGLFSVMFLLFRVLSFHQEPSLFLLHQLGLGLSVQISNAVQNCEALTKLTSLIAGQDPRFNHSRSSAKTQKR